MPSAREAQWTSAPDGVRHVPGVIAADLAVLPDQLLEEHTARGYPVVLPVGREAIAVAERAVMHDDPASATARARREVSGTPAFEVNDGRHDAPPLDHVCDPDRVAPVTVRIRTCHDSSRGDPRFEGVDAALAEAGIDRKRVFLTNAVKQSKWRASGRRRLHERPNSAEVAACRFWLELELRRVKPDSVVALGATAAQALLGRAFRVTKDRGKVVSSRAAEMRAFVRDLRVVARISTGPSTWERLGSAR